MWNDWNREEISIKYAGVVYSNSKSTKHRFHIKQINYKRGKCTIREVGSADLDYFHLIKLHVVGWPLADLSYKQCKYVHSVLESHAFTMINAHNNPVVIEHEMLDKD